MSLFSKKKKQKKTKEMLLNNDTPFAVQEAYKALRTNIMFSFSEDSCKTILVTSSVQGEGKSITAINLALALVNNNFRVLLMDCDLRLPTIAQKLGLNAKPGLTNYLYGEKDNTMSYFQKTNTGLYVMTAGDVPPNPSETLNSKAMQKLLGILQEKFDYIILDTPPVCTVTDAVILSKNASGIVLVVRQDVATYEGVDSTLSQLKLAGANVIGTVMTGTTAIKKNYKKYGYGYSGKKG